MALYENLQNLNIFPHIATEMAPHGPLFIDSETQLITSASRIPHDAYFIFVKEPAGMNCRINFNFLFERYQKVLRSPPIRCQGCWKIVIRPETLRQLFKLGELMHYFKDQVYGCKLGREVRWYVHGLWGGYFYNRSLEEMRQINAMIKPIIKDQIGDIPVIMKRGCTEMEMEFGDSRKWLVTDLQRKQEEHILKHFSLPANPLQPEMAKINAQVEWIRYACKNGDSTYLEYVDKPLHATYMVYE